MKNQILLLLIISVLSGNSFSQQDPLFSSDGFTPFWNNPAATGSFNKFSVNTVYRNQWPALSGNVQNLGFNVEADITFGAKGSDKRLNMPLGINAIFQRIGPQRIQTVNVPLSIPIKIGNSTLAFGVSAGIKNSSTDWSQVTFGDPVPNQDGTVFDLNAGLFWYGKKHYVGISMTNATAPRISNYQLARHYYLQAGYKFNVGKHHIYPMINAGYVQGFSMLRAMTYFQFKEDVFSIGVGYNMRSSFVLGATVSLKKFKLAYLYDFYHSGLSFSAGNAHEVKLSYTIAKDKKEFKTIGTPPF